MRKPVKPSTLVMLAVNLLPLVGVMAWGWDAFVLLMLYWLETAVVALWAVLRIATMRREALDDLQIDPRRGALSPFAMAAVILANAAVFMGVHFLFLWTLFSGEWSKAIDSVGTFIDRMVIGTGLWVPLAIFFFIHGALATFDAAGPWLRRRLRLTENAAAARPAVGPGEAVIFGLYSRVFILQTTIIIGAWFALLAGTAGALAFLVLVKTAVECVLDGLSVRVHDAMKAARANAENPR